MAIAEPKLCEVCSPVGGHYAVFLPRIFLSYFECHQIDPTLRARGLGQSLDSSDVDAFMVEAQCLKRSVGLQSQSLECSVALFQLWCAHTYKSTELP